MNIIKYFVTIHLWLIQIDAIICNNFNDPSGRKCVANKIENLNINVSSLKKNK